MSKLIDTNFRQGDCALIAVKSTPDDATIIDIPGDVILKHGEATGHMHSFRGAEARKVYVRQTMKKERFLHVVKTAYLEHEEHSRIEVPPGIYAIPNQVEWSDDQEPRIVAD